MKFTVEVEVEVQSDSLNTGTRLAIISAVQSIIEGGCSAGLACPRPSEPSQFAVQVSVSKRVITRALARAART